MDAEQPFLKVAPKQKVVLAPSFPKGEKLQ